jgi:hypothetical protein
MSVMINVLGFGVLAILGLLCENALHQTKSQHFDNVDVIRDSPDDSRAGANTCAFSALLQARREVWTTAATIGTPNGGRGMIWPFSLAFGRTPSVG